MDVRHQVFVRRASAATAAATLEALCFRFQQALGRALMGLHSRRAMQPSRSTGGGGNSDIGSIVVPRLLYNNAFRRKIIGSSRAGCSASNRSRGRSSITPRRYDAKRRTGGGGNSDIGTIVVRRLWYNNAFRKKRSGSSRAGQRGSRSSRAGQRGSRAGQKG